MTDRELEDRISTWLMLGHQHPLPPPASPLEASVQAKTKADWNRERMSAVAEMEVTQGIEGTTAGEALQKAIELAHTAEEDHLPTVEKLLRDEVIKPLRLSLTPADPDSYLVI